MESTAYVDFSVFKKTREEKQRVLEIKREWLRNMKVFHGRDWKKHNNFPSKLKS